MTPIDAVDSAIDPPTRTNVGAANAATYPLLKDQLARENLANIAAQDTRLAAEVQGDAGIGAGTAMEADQLGRIWVGDGARFVENGADRSDHAVPDRLGIVLDPSRSGIDLWKLERHSGLDGQFSVDQQHRRAR